KKETMHNDTIVALATPAGAGAIAVLRLSGKDAIALADTSFVSLSGKKLSKQKTHTIHLGHIVDGTRTLDEVLVSVFKNPHSYTGDDVVAISYHASLYILLELIHLMRRNGCLMAQPGEFTLRPFLIGKVAR